MLYQRVSFAITVLLTMAVVPSLSEAWGGHYYGYRHHGYHNYRHHGYHYGHSRHYRHYPSYSYSHRRYYKPYYYNRSPYRESESHNSPDPYDNSLNKENLDTDTKSRYNNDASSRDQQIDNGQSETRGWNALASGRANEALGYFGQEAQANPQQGEPKVGYALAAASAGDLDRGIWAMKRALENDADALHYLQLDSQLQQNLDRLIHQYQERLNRGLDNDNNTTVMIAALHYLRGDIASAKQMLVSTELQSNNPSLEQLNRLVQAHGTTDSPSANNLHEEAIAGEQDEY